MKKIMLFIFSLCFTCMLMAVETVTLVVTNPAPVCSGGSVSIVQAPEDGYSFMYYASDKSTPIANPNSIGVSGTYYITKTDINTQSVSDFTPVIVTILSKPVFTALSIQPFCKGDLGSIIITKDPSYSYTINNVDNGSLVNLTAGDYTLRVITPKGCQSDVHIKTINSAPEKPTFTASAVQPICFGELGSIIINKNTSYTYSVNGVENGSLTNLTSGTYLLRVKNTLGCKSDIQTLIINAAFAKVSTPLVSNYEGCMDDVEVPLSILVNSYTGTLVWYSNANSTTAIVEPSFNKAVYGKTSYWVSQQDALGCESDRAQIVVSIKEPITFDITPDQTICQGNGVNLRVENRTSGTTVTWNASASIIQTADGAIRVQPSTSETFIATVSNGFCSEIDSTRVTVRGMDIIIPTFTAVANQPSSDGETGSITLNKEESDIYYINDVQNGSLVDLPPGDYSLKVQNTEGCESDIQILTINNETGLSENTVAAINIYPNPVGDAFEITGIENKATIDISDINGKLQLTKEVVNNEPISVSDLASGIYTVKITTAKLVVQKKIVKK